MTNIFHQIFQIEIRNKIYNDILRNTIKTMILKLKDKIINKVYEETIR